MTNRSLEIEVWPDEGQRKGYCNVIMTNNTGASVVLTYLEKGALEHMRNLIDDCLQLFQPVERSPYRRRVEWR